jgi:DNA-directed RNA polymerase specialized sigma24 family protein
MTTSQGPGVDDPQPASWEPCPCGHGDLATEMEQQRPLVARAIQGDLEAFAIMYDEHVDDIYRYVLAWTWDSALARELTEQVFRGAVTWLPAIAEGEGELGAWLIALARDAVGQHRGSGWAGVAHLQGQRPPQDAFDAVELLDDAQREVLVLRLLLGHSAVHTAHLAGYDARVVQELQFGACATIWQLQSGMPLEPPPDGRDDLRPRWFEHYLASGEAEAGADPGVASALSVADALRRGAPEQAPLPDDNFVARLRNQLLQPDEDPPDQVAAWAPGPGRLGRAFTMVREQIARHPWVATTVAAVAIGMVIGLQLAGGAPAHSTCAGQSCPSSTAAVASDGGATSPSLPVAGDPGQESTTSGAVPSTTSRSSTTRSSSNATTSVPSTTVAPTTTKTTQPPTTTRPSTTSRRPTTTTQPPTTPTTATTNPGGGGGGGGGGGP